MILFDNLTIYKESIDLSSNKKNNLKILFNLNLSLFASSILILRGCNGSGKTTLLRMIAGLIQHPEVDKILIYRHQLFDLEKPYVSYLGHNLGLKDEFSVIDNFMLYGKKSKASLAALKHMEIDHLVDTKVSNISSGNKQKLAIARIIYSNAMIWLLDEPESHLDQSGIARLDEAIVTRANTGGIVIMSSHLPNRISSTVELDLNRTV